MTTPQARLAALYAETENDTTRRDVRVARGYQQSDEYDRFAVMMTEDRAAFEELPRNIKMATGMYVNQREAARRVAGETA